jgi:AraC-like DNA-binding protein
MPLLYDAAPPRFARAEHGCREIWQDVSQGQQRIGPFAETPQLLRELGADPADVAARVGLDVGVFRNPENAIPFTAAGKLLRTGAVRTGCAHFGLLLGQRSDTRSLGLVGSLMRNAPTLGRALHDLIDNQYRFDRGGVWYLSVRDGVAMIGYAVHQRGIEGIDHFCDGTMAFAFSGIRELCGASPDEVLLARKPPTDVHPYRRLFQAPVRFDAEQSALVFHADQLERPVPGADPRKRKILEEAVAKYRAIALPSVGDQVVQLLRPSIQFNDFSLETVAHRLIMHPRALNRRLQSEGTTFRKLLNEVRFEVAGQLLLATRMGVTEVAAALGYADTGAFSHAFSRMAGTPPHTWRLTGGTSGISGYAIAKS